MDKEDTQITTPKSSMLANFVISDLSVCIEDSSRHGSESTPRIPLPPLVRIRVMELKAGISDSPESMDFSLDVGRLVVEDCRTDCNFISSKEGMWLPYLDTLSNFGR